jgi:hypothetical protein
MFPKESSMSLNLYNRLYLYLVVANLKLYLFASRILKCFVKVIFSFMIGV